MQVQPEFPFELPTALHYIPIEGFQYTILLYSSLAGPGEVSRYRAGLQFELGALRIEQRMKVAC